MPRIIKNVIRYASNIGEEVFFVFIPWIFQPNKGSVSGKIINGIESMIFLIIRISYMIENIHEKTTVTVFASI